MRSFIFLFLYTSLLSAQDTAIQEYADNFAEKKIFKKAIVSAYAQEVESDRIVLDYNGEKVLIPASSLKVITTLSALDLLGEDYTYNTKVAIKGDIDDEGTLKGDLYIIGSGDPTLGSASMDGVAPFKKVLNDIIASVRSAGIYCISGDIIADESIFNSYPINPTWQWNDLGNYYAAGAWGINILDNEYKVYYGQQPKEGRVPRLVNYEPKIPGLVLQNEVRTGKKGSGDNAYIFGGPYNYTKRIVGTIPPGNKIFTIKGAIPDPPLLMAHYLKEALEKEGIQASGYKSVFEKPRGANQRQDIYQVKSPTLGEIVKVTNFKSNNLYCETLLKTIGSHEMKLGSGGAGINSIRKILKRRGVDLDGLQMEDGSGLSARNRVSSKFMSDYLKAEANEITISTATKYLPRGGYDGTVRGFFSKSAARGHVWAKSGSMNGVLSYSGYVQARSGVWISYSIIVNGHSEKNSKVRPYLEQFLIKLYELN